MDKKDYKNLEYIATDTRQKAKFTYVSDYVDLGECTVKTILNDTTTDINLVLDKESLSTVTTNSDVEMRIVLNNDETTSDTYENSVFELEMPEYVTNVNVTNANILYGEGLEIANVSSYEKNGRVIVGVETVGKQTDINSGVLTNGTNIVLNADIDVDTYAPSKETTIKAHVYNSAATNYANTEEYTIGNTEESGYKETKIEYSAPYGVVSINTLSNYETTGKTITSVKQGDKSDYIDIYTDSINSTMELAIMNNYETAISDVVILGRIPFKGVKDIKTGKELGTTIDTKLTSKIVKDETTVGDFTIYYSDNGEATTDLSATSNNWTTEPQSLENVKSYMIVPNDKSYVLEPEKVLKFSYQYEIPENLEHNEYIYGTFATNYKFEDAEEIAVADKVGLTTGIGPKLEVNMETDTKTVKALDKINVTVNVKNTGEDMARDIIANIPVPDNATYVSGETSNSLAKLTLEDNKVVCNLSELSKEAELKITLTFSANNILNNESDEIIFTTEVLAKDLKKEIKATADKITIQRSELGLEQGINFKEPDQYFQIGREIIFEVYVTNLTDSEKTNVIVETQLPKEIQFSKACMIETEGEYNFKEIENAVYDKNTNKVTWTIEKMEANTIKSLSLVGIVGDLDSGLTAKSVILTSQVSANGTDTYKAQDLTVNIGRSSLSVSQTTPTSTYVKEGDRIEYVFSIKNESNSIASDVVLTDLVADGIIIKQISYMLGDEKVTYDVSETENINIPLTVPINSTVDVNVTALAEGLNGEKEKTVTNGATLTVGDSNTVESNKVTHIVQATANRGNESSSDVNDEMNNNEASGSDITKSCKISGTAWLDTNKNGMKDNDEKRLSGITAMLVDSSSGVIKSTTTTENNGEYTFAGIQDGSYLVLFKYDTVLYTVTAYKKEGIETSLNSDAITTKIEQDGKQEYGAVTDVITINGVSVGNIDLGLIEANKFSLGLDKSISKVTVQNAQGTKTETFDNEKLAQCAIKAKYLSGTTVYVEYALTVTNNGDVAGYATELVDYIPEGMTFNSNLNSDWYTGTDGNLYTRALANTELKSGESKTVNLVLTKKMNAENTDIVSNTAEIANDYNVYGISDNNSNPGNKAQGEDDMSTADIIITVGTGGILIYISVIIISLIISSGAVVGTYRIVKSKRKGGV